MKSIRTLIESLVVLMERKDHLIKKLKNLSDSEKEQLIDFFKKKPNLENKIDWNNKNLTFDDFREVMVTTKTERKKKVKKKGILGLKNNSDYIKLKTDESVMDAYIPLHYEASKLIASERIGGCGGKWCTSYQKDESYWDEYVQRKQLVPVYFIGDGDKYAMTLKRSGAFDSLWDRNDKDLPKRNVRKIGFKSIKEFDLFIKTNKSAISKAVKRFIKDKPLNWFDVAIREGKVKVSADANYTIDPSGNDFITWHSGTWIDGEFPNGVWEGGTWKGGTWRDGIWEGGTWEGGLWKNGDWHKGKWLGGTWKDGVWSSGIWEDGVWEEGSWQSGTWKNGVWRGGSRWGGTWHNGEWQRGVWHNGTWRNGVWVNGRWRDGTWIKGEWRYGTWEGGVWRNGIWKSGVWKDGTWNKGTWEDGTWEGGRFNGGVWEDGLWLGGTWLGGTWKNGVWLGGGWLGGTWENGTWGGGTWSSKTQKVPKMKKVNR